VVEDLPDARQLALVGAERVQGQQPEEEPGEEPQDRPCPPCQAARTGTSILQRLRWRAARLEAGVPANGRA